MWCYFVCSNQYRLFSSKWVTYIITITRYKLWKLLKSDNLTLTPGDFVFWIINNFHLISEPSELWSWGTLKSTSDNTSVSNHDLSVIENGGEFWFQVEVHLWVDWFDVGGVFLWNVSEFLGGSTFGKTDFVDGLDSEN